MEHLNEEKMWKLAKYYMNKENGFDENNNLTDDFINLSREVNSHISDCEMCKKKYNIIKEKVTNNELKIEEKDEEKHGVKEERLSEFEPSELEETKQIVMPIPVDPMNDMNFEITEGMIEKYKANPEELENSNYTSAQKEAIRRTIRRTEGKKLVLTANNSRGYADALILALITGFAGGIFMSIILMLCK